MSPLAFPAMDDRPSKLKTVAPQNVSCKVCKADSKLVGVVDFARSCEDVTHAPAPLAGIPIYYHQCTSCGFMFTVAFDDFTPDDFKYWIYNDRYIEADHEYAEQRPAHNGQLISKMFGARKDLPILDYGGGSGKLAEVLSANGFLNAQVYDPFVSQFSQRPKERFPIVVAFEVVEHSIRPLDVFADMINLTAPGGLTIFSTALQPVDIDRLGAQWWYAAPRNGHASLFSQKSLDLIAAQHQLRFRSHPSRTLHMFLGAVPEFALHMQFPHS
jgi:hypothetical protein